VITYDSSIVTATGNGEVLLYVDGTNVTNPYTLGEDSEDTAHIITATAQESYKAISNEATMIILNFTEFEEGGIKYSVNNDKTSVSVVANNPVYSGDISIPNSVNHAGVIFKVTSIGNYAFRSCSGLTSIELPDSVSTIGN